MNKSKLFKYMIALTLMFLVISFGMTSTSYAKEILTIVGTDIYEGVKTDNIYYEPGSGQYKGQGTEKDPFIISIGYDQFIFKFTNIKKYPEEIHFVLKPTGNEKIAKYMISKDYDNYLVKFTKIESRADMSVQPFYVAAPDKGQTNSYIQAGAINDKRELTKYSAPLYTISSKEYYRYSNDVTYILENEKLGNAYLEIDQASKLAPYNSAYVFVATDDYNSGGIGANLCYKLDENQKGDSITYTRIQGNITGACGSEQPDSKTKPTGTVNGSASGVNFSINNTTETVNYTLGNKCGVVYCYKGTSSDALNKEAGWLETLITKCFISVGDIFYNIFLGVTDSNVTIDSLIFNEYDGTVVDFFGAGKGAYVGPIKRVVNGWYKAFYVWAQVIIVIVLVAIGIKAILYAGTEKQSKINGMISGWVLSVIILCFGPYALKYAIEINDILLEILREEGEYTTASVYNYPELLEHYEKNTGGEDSMTAFIDAMREELKNIQQTVQTSGEALNEAMLHVKSSSQTATLFCTLTLMNEIFSGGFLSIFNIDYSKTGVFFEYDGMLLDGKELIGEVINRTTKDKVLTSGDVANIKIKGIATYKDGTTKISDIGNPSLINTLILNLTNLSQKQQEYLQIKYKEDRYEKGLYAFENNLDLMATMKLNAGKTGRFVYAFIWLLLIYQTVALFCLYVKRLIVTAVLIATFPLVVMTYAIEKFMGVAKPQTMKTWVQEYAVNIFIQLVHAVLYVTLIETGLKVFERNKDNWILFVFAVASLFPMEAIIKSMMGLKGSTVKNLAGSYKKMIPALLAAKAIAGARGQYKSINNQYKLKESKINAKHNRQDKRHELRNQLRGKTKNALTRFANARGGALGAMATGMSKFVDVTGKLGNHIHNARKKVQAFNKGARKVLRGYKLMNQFRRNVSSKVGAITTGMAMGGDVQDFAAGAALSGFVAGNARYNPKFDDKGSSQNSGQNGTNKATSASTPAPQAYENGRTVPTYQEARKAENQTRQQQKEEHAKNQKANSYRRMMQNHGNSGNVAEAIANSLGDRSMPAIDVNANSSTSVIEYDV